MRKEEIIERLIEGQTCLDRAVQEGVPESTLYEVLPECNTVAKIEKAAPKKAEESSVFNTDERIINEYLNKNFGFRTIYDFEAFYIQQHIKQPLLIPIVAPFITCVLRKVSDADALIKNMQHHQVPVELVADGMQNLHDSSVYILTLIECEFDLPQYQEDLPGYSYETDEMYLRIKSSPQFDLTIFYQLKDEVNQKRLV
jgi:hypothetical protein